MASSAMTRPDEDALAELGLAHRGQYLPADILETADDGGDDDDARALPWWSG